MTDSAALSATVGFARTRESRNPAPRACMIDPIFLVTNGELVLMSTTTFPGDTPSRTLVPLYAPSPSPHNTARVSRGFASMLNTTSDRSATSFGVFAWWAPASTNSLHFSGVLFQTTTLKPPFIMFRTRCLPMAPRPMNPTVGCFDPLNCETYTRGRKLGVDYLIIAVLVCQSNGTDLRSGNLTQSCGRAQVE